MAFLRVSGQDLDLPRNIALLDTNVLVAYINDRDGNHDVATFVVDDLPDYVWVVSIPVIVEACGLLGSRRGPGSVLNLLRWILTPGKVLILPGSHPNLLPERMLWSHDAWMRQYVVDYVDAHLMELASVISDQLKLQPHLPIATFDTKDFFRCANKGCRYSLYDMHALEFIDFEAI